MKSSLMRSVLTALVFCLPALPRHHRRGYKPHPELCKYGTIFVDGNSESATIARREVPTQTWLRIVGLRDKAEAILKVAETRSETHFVVNSEHTTVAFELLDAKSEELLWDASEGWDQGALKSGGGAAVKVLLAHLSEDAGCGNK